MKLTLTADQKSPVEFAIGNFQARFEPGETVEIADEGFAQYLLAQPHVKRADQDESADEEVTTEKSEVESTVPTKRQKAEKRQEK